MDERAVNALRAVGAALVFATASYHLYWGFPRALVYLEGLGYLLSRGTLPDPRPFLFVAFALVLFAGPYLVTRDVVTLRRAYQLGMVAMGLSILAWMTWHLTDHFAVLFPGNAVQTGGASHTGVINTLVDHYVTNPIEGAIKTIELAAAMVFGALWRWDPDVRSEA